jgi:hypothetical protein
MNMQRIKCRQVKISLNNELNSQTGCPYFISLLEELKTTYATSFPEINIINKIDEAYNGRHNNSQPMDISGNIFCLKDDNALINDFMNFFHPQFMETKRMLVRVEEILAETKEIIERIL